MLELANLMGRKAASNGRVTVDGNNGATVSLYILIHSNSLVLLRRSLFVGVDPAKGSGCCHPRCSDTRAIHRCLAAHCRANCLWAFLVNASIDHSGCGAVLMAFHAPPCWSSERRLFMFGLGDDIDARVPFFFFFCAQETA